MPLCFNMHADSRQQSDQDIDRIEITWRKLVHWRRGSKLVSHCFGPLYTAWLTRSRVINRSYRMRDYNLLRGLRELRSSKLGSSLRRTKAERSRACAFRCSWEFIAKISACARARKREKTRDIISHPRCDLLQLSEIRKIWIFHAGYGKKQINVFSFITYLNLTRNCVNFNFVTCISRRYVLQIK